MTKLDRRTFLELGALVATGVAGAVFSTGLGGVAHAATSGGADDFFFVQLSDSHWGFSDPRINPESEHTLAKAVAAVNALTRQPDFVVFTGDLTHTTDDGDERRRRLARFKEIAGSLRARRVHFLPGEHDASLDGGEAYREFFGPTHGSFERGNVHFVLLDNVSDPAGRLGGEQLSWLDADLAKRDPEQPIVVLAHRPLFDLYPSWDWMTRDGADALRRLERFEHVTVFYGHIHQEHHQTTGRIAHHAARSLIFPLPAPGSVPKKVQIPWDPAHPFAGLGFRDVALAAHGKHVGLTEHPLAAA
jgi:3',5'-cyclic AMP phosphodiesterase CpdA